MSPQIGVYAYAAAQVKKAIEVEEAKETTAGGLLLTQASKEKPSIGPVIVVGPGPLNEEGNRVGLPLSPETMSFTQYVQDMTSKADGSEYITLRASDVMDVLS